MKAISNKYNDTEYCKTSNQLHPKQAHGDRKQAEAFIIPRILHFFGQMNLRMPPILMETDPASEM